MTATRQSQQITPPMPPKLTSGSIFAAVFVIALVIPLLALVGFAISYNRDLQEAFGECSITAVGERYRATNQVEPDQLPNGQVGQVYRSTSGCIPTDISLIPPRK